MNKSGLLQIILRSWVQLYEVKNILYTDDIFMFFVHYFGITVEKRTKSKICESSFLSIVYLCFFQNENSTITANFMTFFLVQIHQKLSILIDNYSFNYSNCHLLSLVVTASSSLKVLPFKEPEGKNHDIDRSHSKRWSKISICEIGNYFWDNPIIEILRMKTVKIRTFLITSARIEI